AQQDPFSIRADWRTDVVPTTPETHDVFLHVLEATDRSRTKPLDVETTDTKEKVDLTFTYRGNRYEVTFNRVGITGGRVRVTAADGRELLDKELAPGVVDADDPHILRCRRDIAEHPLYDSAVGDIAGLTPGADMAELVRALGDARWHVRFYAVRALSAKRDRAAAGLLMTRLKDDDARVAAAAAEALGQLGAAEAQPALMNLLGSPDAEVRRAAAGALGKLKARAAVPGLVKLLDDPNDFVSVAAADALAQIGETSAVEPLAAQLTRRETPHLKTSYLWAIATLGGDAARAHLETFRKSEDATLRACAIGALVRLDGKKSVAMLKALRTDGQKDIRTFAARKLAGFGDASFLGEMVKTAVDTNAAFGERTAALDLLGRTGNRKVADDVAPLLADETQHAYPFNRDAISVHAALALYRLGDPRGLKYLGEAVLRGDQKDAYHVARSAAGALGSVKREDAVPLLAKALEVRRSQTSAFVVQSLWKVTGEDPGADIEIVDWRRAGQDARRWQEWWTRNEAARP
ncbi:MAG TPA: HEAT repeat domain-containing protein, partial [Planctomycetota bacterium]|nr:HEAT repeat domain-containing protein [Planctomycetota bacterium]